MSFICTEAAERVFWKKCIAVPAWGKNKQQQRQPQVLRLRCAPLRMTAFWEATNQSKEDIVSETATIAVPELDVPAQLPNVRIAVLGTGKMGGILLQAFLKQNLFAPDQIHATVAHAEKAMALSTQWGVDVSTDNLAAAQQADLILLGVKPFQVPDLVKQIGPALTPQKTIVSFAASVKTAAI